MSPTCSECVHWHDALVVQRHPVEVRACLVAQRLVQTDTPADAECFERLVTLKTPKERG